MKFENGSLELEKGINLKAPARSVSWNTQKTNLVAVGLFDGLIKIIDVETY